MRLLKQNRDGDFSLVGPLSSPDIPVYAILSHTWGPDSEEVSFQDMMDGTGKDKAGYDKIHFYADQADSQGLIYFWIDTCCIDKRNSVELSEAINSMFRYYRESARCYVYLSDASAVQGQQYSSPSGNPWEPAFRASRWFTRGWTLQELLAPAWVQFFAQDRMLLGDKTSLQRQIHEITGISVSALRGDSLTEFSVEERFKWAEDRQTKRQEDSAYCLLGIFDVFISPIYGEGKRNAIRRLRKEINDTLHSEGVVINQQSKLPPVLSLLPLTLYQANSSLHKKRESRISSLRPIWNPTTAECLHTLASHTGSVNSVAFSPDSQLLASASYDMTVRIWNPATAECLHILTIHEDCAVSVTFSPNSQLLAMSHFESVQVWAS